MVLYGFLRFLTFSYICHFHTGEIKFYIIVTFTIKFTIYYTSLDCRYADRQITPGNDGQLRHFTHPFMQSAFMFIGEMMCLLVFKITFCYYNRMGVRP